MSLIDEDLQKRYFREPVKDKKVKSQFFQKFNGLLAKPDYKDKRRASFLSDSHNSVDLDELEKAESALRKEKKKNFLANIINEWVFLAILGIGMAFLATLMDEIIKRIGDIHIFTLDMLDSVNPADDGIVHDTSQFVVWVLYAVILTTLSTYFVRIISPQAVGSGVPEMKTVLRGATLENYLTLRTLISVFCGLTLAMGSGMPIGKAGPFIHASSIMANLIGQFVFSFDAHAEVINSKQSEILAVGCAVGTSSVFRKVNFWFAPIGGVLFAIEVTSAYFSVRNYMKCFFAAVICSTCSRLLRVSLKLDDTIGALVPTSFPDNSFFAEELIFFAFVGLICGFFAIAFIILHRKFVLCRRNNPIVKRFFDLHWSLYPISVSLLVSIVSYPDGFGNLLGGERKFGSSARDFFANCTWSANENATNFCPEELRKSWLDSGDLNVYLVLFCFVSVYLLLSALAATLPIPNGASGSSFIVGAAVGRLIGELVSRSFPDGIRNDHTNLVYPGLYSVVGAAALCGGFTHTISAAIIAFEMTGQLVAILPVLTAVLISTAICAFFQPSFYESLIQLKNLPYLPDIPPSANCHGIVVEQFMIQKIPHLTPKSTYADIKEILEEDANIRVVPVIENQRTKLLIGTCHRKTLQNSIDQMIGAEKRHAEAEKRMKMLSKVFRYKGNLSSTQSQSSINQRSFGSTFMNAFKTANSANNLYKVDSAEGINSRKVSRGMDQNGRFTITKTEPSRGWSIVKQAIADKRIHQMAKYEEYLQEQQQQSTKKVFLKDLARKLADVSNKLSQLPDLHGVQREEWEQTQLSGTIDLKLLEMDSAPFRLIVGTSLLNVYSLFSLLCLNRAYVTNYGKLVGMVGLAEIQKALEDVQAGTLCPLPKKVEGEEESDLNIRKNFTHFRKSFRRLARKSIVQFMETDENPWINQKWTNNFAHGMQSKID